MSSLGSLEQASGMAMHPNESARSLSASENSDGSVSMGGTLSMYDQLQQMSTETFNTEFEDNIDQLSGLQDRPIDETIGTEDLIGDNRFSPPPPPPPPLPARNLFSIADFLGNIPRAVPAAALIAAPVPAPVVQIQVPAHRATPASETMEDIRTSDLTSEVERYGHDIDASAFVDDAPAQAVDEEIISEIISEEPIATRAEPAPASAPVLMSIVPVEEDTPYHSNSQDPAETGTAEDRYEENVVETEVTLQPNRYEVEGNLQQAEQLVAQRSISSSPPPPPLAPAMEDNIYEQEASEPSPPTEPAQLQPIHDASLRQATPTMRAQRDDTVLPSRFDFPDQDSQPDRPSAESPAEASDEGSYHEPVSVAQQWQALPTPKSHLLPDTGTSTVSVGQVATVPEIFSFAAHSVERPISPPAPVVVRMREQEQVQQPLVCETPPAPPRLSAKTSRGMGARLQGHVQPQDNNEYADNARVSAAVSKGSERVAAHTVSRSTSSRSPNTQPNYQLKVASEQDALVQYKASLMLQTQLIDKIMETRAALVAASTLEDHTREEISLEITTEMLRKAVLKSEVLSCIALGGEAPSATTTEAVTTPPRSSVRSASANRSAGTRSLTLHTPPGTNNRSGGSAAKPAGWRLDSLRRTPTGALDSTPLTGGLKRSPATGTTRTPEGSGTGLSSIYSASPIESLMRNPAAVHSLVGNIDNYCSCCRTKLVDVHSLRSIRQKHNTCRNCIHR